MLASLGLAFALATTGTAAAAPATTAAPGTPVSNPSGFVIRRGTNVSHWLSQDFGWAPRETVFTENDVRFLARSGFDHVRLPVDEKELWTEDGKPIEPAFALLQRALGWCRDHQLRVIVDLHTVRSHHFNAENEGLKNTLWTDPKAQERFLGLWKELSARLREQPVSQLAYEIMNEPVADDHEDWNKLVAASLATLRALEPKRVVIIGSNRWQIPSTLPFLRVPADDRNLILSTHTYSPLVLTHYKADWMPLKIYTGSIRYPGVPITADEFAQLKARGQEMEGLINNAQDEWNAARIARELAPAIARAKELGLQLYCGEFGCMPTIPRAARLAYYRDLVGVFEAHGLAWANWEYKGDFGVFEWHAAKTTIGAPDVEMLDALFQRR